jgi:hypothetical protein
MYPVGYLYKKYNANCTNKQHNNTINKIRTCGLNWNTGWLNMKNITQMKLDTSVESFSEVLISHIYSV